MSEKNEDSKAVRVGDADDLDELLQSALDDFDKPIPVTPAVKEERTSTSSDNIQEDFEEKFKSLLLNDIDDASFSSKMSNLLQEVNNGIRSCSGTPNVELGDDNSDTVSQAINSLVENIEQIKGSLGNEQLPSNFDFGGNNDNVFPVMEQMFQMLMSKEVLYPSLLSVKEKYPSWIEENKHILDTEEVDRYTNQYNIIKKICVIFELENDSDTEDVKQKRFIELLALLQEMTNLGQPPKDFAESLPTMGNDMFGSDMDPNSCNTM